MCTIYKYIIIVLGFHEGLGHEIPHIKRLYPNDLKDGSILYEVNFKKELKFKIPEECLDIGICEDIPDFPEEQIAGLIDTMITDKIHFNKDQESEDDPTKFNSVEKIELCEYKNVIFKPKAVKDFNNDWYLILNTRYKNVQCFLGEVCQGELKAPCSQLASFPKNYEGCCIQKYTTRSMLALSTDFKKVIVKDLPVASCCSCAVIRKTGK